MFESTCIDSALAMTLTDLFGFQHPLGIRVEYAASAKILRSTISNFMNAACGYGQKEPCVLCTEHVSWRGSSFEEYLAMCQACASACNPTQKKMVAVILNEMMRQHIQIGEKIKKGETNTNPDYLEPIEKTTVSGKVLIALSEAFEIPLPQLEKSVS
ncbi:MAG: hypothetical protein HGA67_03230 [Candidatus Yonathbacteria bacterium]|nr:hypothetical protein [Candidatus Yonathbacteria bacterium]